MKRVMVEIDSGYSVSKKNKMDIKKSEDLSVFKRMILSALDINHVNSITHCIYLVKAKKLIVPYLSETDYFISNWAFKHESMPLLTELFKLPEDRHQFLMLSHNNYFVVKEFIQGSVQLPFEEYQKTADTKHQILTLIMQFKPHILQEVVEQAIQDAITITQSKGITLDNDTVRTIKSEFKEVVDKLNFDNVEEQTENLNGTQKFLFGQS